MAALRVFAAMREDGDAVGGGVAGVREDVGGTKGGVAACFFGIVSQLAKLQVFIWATLVVWLHCMPSIGQRWLCSRIVGLQLGSVSCVAALRADNSA